MMFNTYYYGGGYSYLLFILPALIITLIAQVRVKSAFAKYSQVSSPLSGAEAARKVLDANGLYNVRIEYIGGNLTDHFDPKTNVIRLSEQVYNAKTVAAVGVACHEAGHAVQYAVNYAPMKWRAAIIPATQIGSKLAIPLILIGLLISTPIAWLGIIFYSFAVLFQLITLPVEFNASKRAMDAIKNGNLLLSDENTQGARSVLTAAAMTYVAAMLTALAQLLRLVLMVRGNNRRR